LAACIENVLRPLSVSELRFRGLAARFLFVFGFDMFFSPIFAAVVISGHGFNHVKDMQGMKRDLHSRIPRHRSFRVVLRNVDATGRRRSGSLNGEAKEFNVRFVNPFDGTEQLDRRVKETRDSGRRQNGLHRSEGLRTRVGQKAQSALRA